MALVLYYDIYLEETRERRMTITYEDFLQTVTLDNHPFVEKLHENFIQHNCKLEVKEAKQGYVVTYSYMREKKRVALMNYVFRKSGMMVRIYARHISMYQSVLDSLPESMKKEIGKALDCKRLNGTSQCSPTCTAGYDFIMDKVNYKKCKNGAFFWKVGTETMEYIKKIVESELKYIDID